MSHNTLSSVRMLNNVDNSASSIIQIGDRGNSNLYSKSIVVVQDVTNNTGDEPLFEQYAIFCKPTPYLDHLLLPTRIVEQTYITEQPLNFDAQPDITIGHLKIISNSSSSNIQIGNGKRLFAEYRTKSFEQHGVPSLFKKRYPL